MMLSFSSANLNNPNGLCEIRPNRKCYIQQRLRSWVESRVQGQYIVLNYLKVKTNIFFISYGKNIIVGEHLNL